MKKLHQVQVLDCRLVVEIANAKDEDIPLPDLKSKQKYARRLVVINIKKGFFSVDLCTLFLFCF